MTSPLRIALIGAGRVAEQHVSALESLSSYQIAWVVDPREEIAEAMASRIGGARHSRSYSDVLNDDDVDVVDVMVPHDLHFPIARDALQAGKHVILDKPLATTPEDGETLVTIARQNQLVLGVVHNLLFHPAMQHARRVVESGSLGAIRTAAAWSRGWLDLSPWDFRRSREQTGGGAWVDNGPHLLYGLESLLGPCTDCVTLRSTSTRLGGEDSVCAVARFASGATGSLRISYSERVAAAGSQWPAGWAQGFNVGGENGWLTAEVMPLSRVRWLEDGQVREETFTVPFSETFAGVFHEVADAIRGNSSLTIPPEDALRLLRLTLASAPEDKT